MSRANKRLILIFAKQPVPGRAKTRLAATVGTDRASELARAFLEDVLLHASDACRRMDAALAIAFAPDDATVVLGTANGAVMPVQLDPKKFLPAIANVKQAIRALAFSPDGEYLAISLRDAEGVIVNLSTHAKIGMGGVGKAAVLTFGSERKLFGALADGGVFVCDVKTNEVKLAQGGSRNTPGIAVASGARRALFLSHPMGQPRVLGAPVEDGHEDIAVALLRTPDGRLASAGTDGTVRTWDVASGREVACAREHEEEVVSLAAGPGGTLVLKQALA